MLSHSDPQPLQPQARPTLTLKRSTLPAAAPMVDMPVTAADSEPEPVPDGTTVSFCNWRVGAKRPTRRYLTAEAALAEAHRLRTLFPDAKILTFRLELVGEDRP